MEKFPRDNMIDVILSEENSIKEGIDGDELIEMKEQKADLLALKDISGNREKSTREIQGDHSTEDYDFTFDLDNIQNEEVQQSTSDYVDNLFDLLTSPDSVKLLGAPVILPTINKTEDLNEEKPAVQVENLLSFSTMSSAIGTSLEGIEPLKNEDMDFSVPSNITDFVSLSNAAIPEEEVNYQELADEEEKELDLANSAIDADLLSDKENMHEETSAQFESDTSDGIETSTKEDTLGYTASPNREIDTVLLTEKEIAHQELTVPFQSDVMDTTEKETTIKDERLVEISTLSSSKFNTELIAVKNDIIPETDVAHQELNAPLKSDVSEEKTTDSSLSNVSFNEEEIVKPKMNDEQAQNSIAVVVNEEKKDSLLKEFSDEPVKEEEKIADVDEEKGGREISHDIDIMESKQGSEECNLIESTEDEALDEKDEEVKELEDTIQDEMMESNFDFIRNSENDSENTLSVIESCDLMPEKDVEKRKCHEQFEPTSSSLVENKSVLIENEHPIHLATTQIESENISNAEKEDDDWNSFEEIEVMSAARVKEETVSEENEHLVHLVDKHSTLVDSANVQTNASISGKEESVKGDHDWNDFEQFERADDHRENVKDEKVKHHNEESDWNDFNDFETTSAPITDEQECTNNTSKDFGDFSSSLEMQKEAEADFGDDFGDFESATPEATSASTVIAASTKPMFEDLFTNKNGCIKSYGKSFLQHNFPNCLAIPETVQTEGKTFAEDFHGVEAMIQNNITYESHSKVQQLESSTALEAKEKGSITLLRSVLKAKLYDSVVLGVLPDRSEQYLSLSKSLESDSPADIKKSIGEIQAILLSFANAATILKLAQEAALSAEAVLSASAAQKQSKLFPFMSSPFKLGASSRASTIPDTLADKRDSDTNTMRILTPKKSSSAFADEENGSSGSVPKGEDMYSNDDASFSSDDIMQQSGSADLPITTGTSKGLMRRLGSKVFKSSLVKKQQMHSIQLRRYNDPQEEKETTSSPVLVMELDLDKVNGGMDEIKWQCAKTVFESHLVREIAPSQIQLRVYPNGTTLGDLVSSTSLALVGSKKYHKALLAQFLKRDSIWSVEIITE